MDTKKFNRDYTYVSRLSERVKDNPHDLLLPNVNKRLHSIRQYWKGPNHGSPTIADVADVLLKTPTNGIKPRIGSKALVSMRMRDGNIIKVPCLVLNKTKLFNRYEVTPIGGEGKTVVSSTNVAFIE